MATVTQKKPIYSTRHNQLDVAVWENTGVRRTFHNVSLKKSYKDGEEWKHTQASFAHDDTLVIAKLLNWADDVVQTAYDQQEQFADSDTPFATKTRETKDMLDAEVWQKMEEQKLRYRVKLIRTYQDGDQSKSVVVWLASEDCLDAVRLLERAFDAIDSHVAASGSSFAETAKQQPNAETTPPDEEIPF